MNLIILRGPSGFGKSTYAATMRAGAICSADNYFVHNGVYNFDASKLSEAHQQCLQSCIAAMKEKKELIVVDNTNTKKWEYEKYIEAAKNLNYCTEIIEFIACCDEHALELAKRNVHKVPTEIVMRQYNRFQLDERAAKVIYACSCFQKE